MPIIILLLVAGCHGYSQQIIHLSANLKQQLKAQCTFCQLHPQDSTRIIPAADKTGNTQITFHNSIVALENGDLDDAYAYTLNTITHADSIRDKNLCQNAYFIKAKILYYKKLYTAATEEYLRLLTTPALNAAIKSTIYTNLGELYMVQKNFTLALTYFDTWQKLYAPAADLYSTKSVYQNKGLCFFYLGRYKEAEESYWQTIHLGQKLQDTTALAISYANLGNFYYNQLLDSKAIPCFQQSLEYAQQSKNIEILKDANLNMAVVEENRNQFKKAIAYRKQYELLQDSIWNRDNIWKLTSQERKFEAQLNENKILLLEQQAALNKNQLKVRALQRNTFLAAAILFLILSGLAYWAYRLKAKKNGIILKQKEELDLLNKTKDRLYSIVAHDLRSPIHSLKTNLVNAKKMLTQNCIDEADAALTSAQTTTANAYALLDNLLHWALSQTNQLFFRTERLQLAAIVKQVCFDYGPFALLKNITIRQNVAATVYLQADLNSLKIILRNLLDNALKYTHPGGLITIAAAIKENRCCLQITDSGIGMPESVLKAIFSKDADKLQQDANGLTSTGIGLDLCRMMAEKNEGTIHINSEKGKGTDIEISFILTA